MNPRLHHTLILLLIVAFGCASPVLAAAESGSPAPFAKRVDLSPLGRIAVMTDGRIKSFDSHANAMMQFVSGPKRIADQSPAFTFIDMMFRPDAYRDADVIYVKNKLVRNAIADELARLHPDLVSRLEIFRSSGLISDRLLSDPGIALLLERFKADLIRTEKSMREVESARSLLSPDVLMDSLRVIPASAGLNRPWHSLREIWPQGDPSSANPSALNPAPPIEGLDPALQKQIADTWLSFAVAWYRQDADAVTAASRDLSSLVRQADSAGLYPTESRLSWESWYFKAKGMVWIWMIYLLALILLSMAFIYRWNWARAAGLSVFFLAFGFHTFALLLRWYVSGRWPNANMFEAVTTSAWFGGVGAVILEHFARRHPMRNLFALGSAGASMVALMAAHFLPVQLNPNISNIMPVLHDVWLYIHTNVIIFSYVLIFMAAFTAIFYLGYYFICRMFLNVQPDYARMGGAGLLMQNAQLEPVAPISAAMGAAARAELNPVPGSKAIGIERPRVTVGEVLDGATMLLMEISFILLWAGIVMGAIWADHSWGRPWGWDPKEVFALNTFIIFAILIHVRLKVKEKGLWTAVLAVVGAGVMLFNWIVINFVISGLHSYA